MLLEFLECGLGCLLPTTNKRSVRAAPFGEHVVQGGKAGLRAWAPGGLRPAEGAREPEAWTAVLVGSLRRGLRAERESERESEQGEGAMCDYVWPTLSEIPVSFSVRWGQF